MSGNGDEDSPKKALSFKDRIAMFNAPKAADPPGPPPRATKPRAFKWKTSDEADTSKKTVSVDEVPPPAPTPTPGAAPAAPVTGDAGSAAGTSAAPAIGEGGSGEDKTDTLTSGAPLKPVSSAASGASAGSGDSKSAKAFSAEDARQTSGSLKDRIALLSGGFKPDAPGAPGRAPKPWRKKSTSEDVPKAEAAAEDDIISPSSETKPSEVESVPDTHATEKPKAPSNEQADEEAASDKLAGLSIAPPSQPTGEEEASPSATSPSGVAMPAMPTRTRGPQRKGRSGGTASAAAAPSATTPSAEKPETSVAADTKEGERAPSIQELASPAVTPAVGNDDAPVELKAPAAAVEAGHTDKPASDAESEPTNAPLGIARAPPTVPGNRPLPGPSPTAATAADDEEDEEEADEEDKEVDAVQTGLAKQSLSNEPAEPKSPLKVSSSEAAPSMPTAARPAPPPLDTQFSGSPDAPTSPASVKSPSLSNRRSMTRPPVPTGYTRPAAAPESPRHSTDNVSQRSSVIGSSRESMVLSPVEPVSAVSAEPQAMSSVVEPVPTPVEVEKEVIPPMDTSSSQSSAMLPKSPIRQASTTSRASIPSPQARPTEEEPETNISAMRAYRASTEETPEKDDGKEEEGEEEEDPEVARRQALAKRMAAMGGMKIGMMPSMFGGTPKKKKTLPKEPEPEQEAAEPVLASAPAVPAPSSQAAGAESSKEPESPSRPPPVRSPTGSKPPPGAFVLPSLGKPAAPAPPPPPEEEDIDQEDDEAFEPEQETPHAEMTQEDFEPQGDDTVTQEVEEIADEPHSPPPILAERPSRPLPPPGQSFIEDDTDTEGGTSDKRTSFSSAGVGSVPDFPEPPTGSHTRTDSYASRYSAVDQPETVHEEPDSFDDNQDYDQQSQEAAPARPSRPAPVIDTGVLAGGSNPSRRTSMAEPASPSQSMRSYSQRSIPGTPASATHSRQDSFAPLSPTPSGNSRRSSAIAGQAGFGPSGGQPVQPGLNNEYLAYLATNAAKTKGREIDGPLAHSINDIAYTYRSDPANFGVQVYRSAVSGVKGMSPDLQIQGRIEAGCVFLAWDAKFDRGLGRSSLKVGSSEVPHVAIVAESVKDIKKAKVKVVELAQGRHNVETYKLDDLKNGIVEIRRLA